MFVLLAKQRTAFQRKDAISVIPVSPGTVVQKYQLGEVIAFFLSDISAKNCQKSVYVILLVAIIVSQT